MTLARGVLRGGVCLLPPTRDDLQWVAACHDLPDVWRMFGLDGSARLRFLMREREGGLVIGIAFHAADRRRFGFAVVYPPRPEFELWELTLAVPDPKDRDAFSAMAVADAIIYYMLEAQAVPELGWRTRPDNRAAEALLRRMRYTPTEAPGGERYNVWRVDRAAFEHRRRRAAQAGGLAFIDAEPPPLS